MASVLSATKSENIRILKLLLQGPTESQDVQSAFVYACQQGLAECVNCLISNAIDVNEPTQGGKLPLEVAVIGGHVSVINALLEAGADVNARSSVSVNSIAHLCVVGNGDVECLDALIQHGCRINVRDREHSTLLMTAIKGRRFNLINTIIEAGCDVNGQDKDGRTALHFASLWGFAIEPLINARADINIADNDESTPLLWAATEAIDNVLSYIIHVPGCDVNKVNQSAGKTALHILSYKGHRVPVRLLLEKGASPDVKDAAQRTPLWYAVANGHLGIVIELLTFSFTEEQLKCRCEDNNPTNCAVQLAMDQGLAQVLKLLIWSGFDRCHIQSKLRQMLIVSTDTDGSKLEELHQLASYGHSLQQLCRNRIRHFIRPPQTTNIKTLPIPDKFIQSVLMNDLN